MKKFVKTIENVNNERLSSNTMYEIYAEFEHKDFVSGKAVVVETDGGYFMAMDSEFFQ